MVRQFQIVTLPGHGQTWLIHLSNKQTNKQNKNKKLTILITIAKNEHMWLYFIKYDFEQTWVYKSAESLI